MKELNQLYSDYIKLDTSLILDYNRYNELLLIHSSSAIEGSTLTLEETELLLNENITPKGKPLEHSLMVKDHEKALLFISEKANDTNQLVDERFLKEIGSRVMNSTGGKHNSVLGAMRDSQEKCNSLMK